MSSSLLPTLEDSDAEDPVSMVRDDSKVQLKFEPLARPDRDLIGADLLKPITDDDNEEQTADPELAQAQVASPENVVIAVSMFQLTHKLSILLKRVHVLTAFCKHLEYASNITRKQVYKSVDVNCHIVVDFLQKSIMFGPLSMNRMNFLLH